MLKHKYETNKNLKEPRLVQQKGNKQEESKTLFISKCEAAWSHFNQILLTPPP